MRDYTILELNHISKTFFIVIALDDSHCNLRKGEVQIFSGKNGAGKSMLVKILLNHKEVKLKNPRHVQRLEINTNYQELNSIPFSQINLVILNSLKKLKFQLHHYKDIFGMVDQIRNERLKICKKN